MWHWSFFYPGWIVKCSIDPFFQGSFVKCVIGTFFTRVPWLNVALILFFLQGALTKSIFLQGSLVKCCIAPFSAGCLGYMWHRYFFSRVTWGKVALTFFVWDGFVKGGIDPFFSSLPWLNVVLIFLFSMVNCSVCNWSFLI